MEHKDSFSWIAKLTLALVILIVGGVYGASVSHKLPSITVWKQGEKPHLPIYCVNISKPVVSLTFDVAWENKDIGRILRILKDEQVTATFFVSGDWMKRYPKDVKRIVKAGHDLGNHGDGHRYMTRLCLKKQREEIQGAHDKAKAIAGVEMDLFRPPYGDYNAQVIKTARQAGYESIQWSVDSLDWQEPKKMQLIERVCRHKQLSKGAIILLHTGTTVTQYALKDLIRQLSKQGYGFVPVSRLIYRGNYRINGEGKQFQDVIDKRR